VEYYWPHSYEYIEGVGQTRPEAGPGWCPGTIEKIEGKAALIRYEVDSKDLDWVSADRIRKPKPSNLDVHLHRRG